MRVSRSIAGAAVLSLVAAVAFAQPPAQPVHVRQACAADIPKLCANATPGRGGGMGKCLRANFAQLSDPCKTAIQQRMAARNASQPPAAPPS